MTPDEAAGAICGVLLVPGITATRRQCFKSKRSGLQHIYSANLAILSRKTKWQGAAEPHAGEHYSSKGSSNDLAQETNHTVSLYS